MRIGIYGGSFNPPHNGHKKVIETLISSGVLDKIYVVPTGRNYVKKGLEKFEHRRKMLDLALIDVAGAEIVDIEDRDTQVYTYMTLDYFREKNPSDEICFIMGSDNLLEFDTWKEAEYMMNNYSFVVIMRGQHKIENMGKYVSYKNIKFVENLSTLASSDLRELLSSGKDISQCVDIRVLDYIKANKLYVEQI